MEHFLTWFDNRTLLICQLLLALLLASALFLLRRVTPDMRGIGYMSAGYFLGIPGLLLVIVRGSIPLVVSTTVGNGILFLSYYCIFVGLQRFVGDRSRYAWLLEISGILGILDLIYFTSVTPNIVPRSMAVAWFIGLARLLSALTLWRFSNGRLLLRAGCAIYAIFAFISFQRFILTFTQGSPQNYMQRDSVQTISLITGFIFIGITGLFKLALITNEMRAATVRDAQIDSLTGALTRAAIEDKFARELELAGRTGLPLSLMLLDIDHFKNINDTAGHAAGDDALRAVAGCISSQLRTYDIFGRFGGDELMLLLPATPGPDALMVAGRIRNAIQKLPPIQHGLQVALSIGIAQSEGNDSTNSLMARADAALYQVKRTGRNAMHFQPYTVTAATPAPSSGPHVLAD